MQTKAGRLGAAVPAQPTTDRRRRTHRVFQQVSSFGPYAGLSSVESGTLTPVQLTDSHIDCTQDFIADSTDCNLLYICRSPQIQGHTSLWRWRRRSGGLSCPPCSARPHLVVTPLEGDQSNTTLGYATLSSVTRLV